MINREYATAIKHLMPDRDRDEELDKPVSLWKELDRIRGYPEQTTVVIFKTKGCSWFNFSSCSMCGYFNDVSSKIEPENLYRQIDLMASSLSDSKVLKVFTSGSFLDPREVPLEVRDYFYESIEGKIEKALVESRTEYITEKNLQKIGDYKVPTRVAIGLESANDYIMKYSVNKGSTFSKFKESAEVLKKLKLELRTYLLFKPPFISEREAVEDALYSINAVAHFSDDVSVNPMNIQKNTMVEKLWKAGLYRPPRLWSLAEVLLRSKGCGTSVVSYPTGGDKLRGVHNEERDRTLLNLIFESSLSQDFSPLEEYYSRGSRESFDRRLDSEDVLIFQSDYNRLVTRISSSCSYL
ncbi:Fe-S osidoreductase [uncultured archaeon]|nr:Fe-S osidoreductase [uncultured archaeon]